MNNPIKTYAVLAALVLLAACQPVTHEGKGIGVVFMHGRGAANPTGGGTGDLVRSMERYGVSVAAPRMPWAGSRGEPDYSGAMEDAQALVKAEIARLRAGGNGIIILGGMSAGGLSAIGMAALLDGIAGVMAIAPAPTVDLIDGRGDHPALLKLMARMPPAARRRSAAIRNRLWAQTRKAMDLIAAGKGDAKTRFQASNINNQGRYDFDIITTPNIYFSYNDPNGMRAMSLNTPKLNPKTALLWVNDNQGLTRRLGRSYAFDLARANAGNRYVELDVLHLGAPAASAEIVREWLLRLAPPKPAG